MTRKFNSARKDAFLAALRVSGNETLSAERAKVSRSWVTLRRSKEPEFDAAVRGAVKEARALLRQVQHDRGLVEAQGERSAMKPRNGWGHLDGAELVVRGTGGNARGPAPGGGTRVQIARARVRQWSPRVEERFLAALAATCNVKAACAEVGLSAVSAYNHRNRWPAFARRWDEAVELGYTLIEFALMEAAGNFLSGEAPVEPGPAAAVREMTVDHAIHLLHMHKRQARGLGKRPGRAAREPDIEEVRAEFVRKLAAIERARALRAG